jgi:diguanylate cyclase (GGDEF)-like protein/PAS domain S-box-containing protein
MSDTKTLRILHVEDSPLDAELISERLNGFEYPIKIDWVSNEQDFVSSLQRGGYDLVFADYRLPSFDAPSALKITKSLNPSIPFICISGAIGEEKAVELLKLGATDYVIKDRLDKLPIALHRAIKEVNERNARLLMEKALRESEKRLRTIIENEPECIKILDAQQHLLQMNQAGLEMIEADSLEQVAGKSVLDVIAPEYREAFLEMHKRVIAGESMQMEYEAIGLKGGRRFLETHAVPMEDNGEILHLAVTRDITKSKQAEKEREEALGRLQKIASSLPGLVYQYRLRPNGSSYFPFASDAIHDIYRISPEDVCEDASIIFKILFPDDYNGYVASIQKSARDLSIWHYEYRVKYDDGTIRWLLGNALPEREIDGSTLWHGFVTDITERKQMEQVMKESEQRYRMVADFTSDWEYWILPDNTFQYIAPSCKLVSGYSQFEFYTDPKLITKIIHPDDMHIWEGHSHQISDQGLPEPIDFRIFTKNGECRWISHICRPIYDYAGQSLGVRASNRDITKRKQTEEALMESEQKLFVILESVDAFIYLKDTSYRYLFANRPVCELFGVPKEEIIGQTDEKFFDENSIVQIRENDRFVLEKGEMLKSEENNTKDGRILTFLSVKLPLRNELNEIYALCGISTDITERKQIENALKESEKRFRDFFEKNSSVMLLIEPISGNIIEANESATTYYGYPKEKLVCMSMNDIISLPPESTDEEKKQDTREEFNYFILQHRLASGEIRDVEVHLTPIESDGRSLLLSIIHDITDRIQLEEKLKEISIHDPLTNVFNRRYIFDRLEGIYSEYLRDDNVFSVLIIDLDHFKNVNDTLGHQAGDFVLVEFTKIIKSYLRAYDLIGRYGGEEFIIIFINTRKEHVLSKVGGLLDTIRNTIFVYKEANVKITFSGGISDSSEFEKSTFSIEKIIEAADNRLYEAKNTGRNKIV